MKLRDIVSCVNASEILTSEASMEREFVWAFAGDLMSDVLAYVQTDTDKVVLLTGLANSQVIRTVEMLDIQAVIFVRGKTLSEEDLAIAKEKQLAMFTTTKTMYEACGLLYEKGITSYQIV